MRIAKFVVFALCLACIMGAVAQTVPATYALGPQDTITVTVLRHPEFSGSFLVPPDGVVDFPGVGKLTVDGLTIGEVRRQMSERLSARLRAPEVSVTLMAQRMRRVYVLGGVVKPGIYEYKDTWRIAEALAAAGGLSTDPQEHTITVWRAVDGERLSLNLPGVLAADPEANIVLNTGDVITIGTMQKVPVYVTGLVQRPGVLQLRPGEGTAEALALVGGMTKPAADVKVTLQRDGATMPVEVRQSVPMRQGDILMVQPLRDVRVMVTGQVASPGFYELRQDEGVLEALALAGGATAQASLTRLTIMRAGGEAEQVDLTPLLLDAEAGTNVPLRDGDLVLVPENTNTVTVLGYVKQPGRYPLRDDKSWVLTDALGLAGGHQERRAGVNKVAMVRTCDDGTQSREVIDLSRFYRTGDTRYNPDVRPGDIVYVPETNAPDWSFIFQGLSSLSILGNTLAN